MRRQRSIHTWAYHFNNLDFSVQPKVIQEHLKVFLHLDAVIIHLSYGKDTHLTLSPYLSADKQKQEEVGGDEDNKWWSMEMNGERIPSWVDIRLRHFVWCTLCWRSRKGSSISIPPSWTTHQTSMVPSRSRSCWGKLSTFFATSKAWWAAVVSRIVSEEDSECFHDCYLFIIFWRI